MQIKARCTGIKYDPTYNIDAPSGAEIPRWIYTFSIEHDYTEPAQPVYGKITVIRLDSGDVYKLSEFYTLNLVTCNE